MISDVKAKVEHATPEPLTEDNMEYIRMSRLGQLWTADWRYKLIAAGKAYRMNIGTVAGSGAYTLVGNGTAVDLDLPQGVVAVDSGYLIPMALQISGICDIDAENDVADILLTADRATAVPASELAAGTAETPCNLLDGGDAFEGRAASILTTTPITDPIHTDILYFQTQEAIGADELIVNKFGCDKVFDYPNFLAGACSLLLYVAGTVAATFMGSLVFAHVPTSWVPTS
jgi:hypothetical protein